MPGAIFITPEGKKQYVKEEDFASALQNELVPQSNLDVIDPVTNQPISLSPEEAANYFNVAGPAAQVDPEYSEQAMQQRLAEEQYSGLGNQALAGVAGVARGATLGLSDVALRGLGVEGEDLQGLRQANPTTSVVGEIGGAIAPALLSGGQTAPASVARALPAGLAFRAGQAASRGATGVKGLVQAGVVEGAIHGAGQAVSNLAIRDEPLSVESVVSEVGLNTLLGGGFGAAGGAIGWGLGKAGGKLLGRAERKAAEAAIDGASLTRESLGSISGASKKAFNELDELAPQLFSKADDFVRGTRESLDDLAVQGAVNQLDTLANQGKAYAANLGKHGSKVSAVEKAQAKLATAEGDEAVRAALDAYKKSVDDLASAVGYRPSEALNITAKTKLTKPDGFDEALDVAKRAHDDFVKAGLNKNPLEVIMASDSVEEMVEKAAKLDNLGKAMSNLDELTEAGLYSSRFNEAMEELSGKAQNLMGETASGMDLVSMAALFGIEEALLPNFEGPVDDIIKLALAMKFAGVATKGAKRGAGFVRNVIGGAARSAVAQKAFAGGGGLAAGAKNAAGQAAISKLIDATMAGSGRIQSATAKASIRIQKALGKLAGKTGKAISKSAPVSTSVVLRNTNFSTDKVPRKESELQAFRRIQNQISTMMANPKAAAEKIHNNLLPIRQGHLGVGDKMAGHLMNVVGFLNARMPTDPGRLQYFGKSKWRPTRSELDKFAKLVNAVNDPVGAVERLAEGRMTRQDADALRHVHPAMFQQLQDFLLDNIEEVQNFPYRQRIQISTLMGIQADPVVSRTHVWQRHFQNDAMMQQEQGAALAQPEPGTTAQQLSAPRGNTNG